jgi:hypothetical protein
MKNFLTAILPDQGVYFIAAKAGAGFAHYPCHTFDEMVQKALEIDAQGRDVYFACASFKKEFYLEAGGKRRQRTAENAGWVKSFFFDIDCGPDKAAEEKGYVTARDAGTALKAFIDAVGVPNPFIVSSGGGLHVYWSLREAITKEQWQPIAEQLKALSQCPAIRLLVDDSRTSDVASILRPVETHNFKPERNGAVVAQLFEGSAIDFDKFSQIIHKAHQAHCGSTIRPGGVVQLSTTQSGSDPETPEAVARVKSALAAINPDCDRDQWRDICFAVHSTGWTCAEELARSWSKGDLI